jgi:hypothetical protein
MRGGPQFRVLYREFLFRMVDLEVLSAHALGDVNKLLGQFAALLVFISMLLSGPVQAATIPPHLLLSLTLTYEHFLIATTMPSSACSPCSRGFHVSESARCVD